VTWVHVALVWSRACRRGRARLAVGQGQGCGGCSGSLDIAPADGAVRVWQLAKGEAVAVEDFLERAARLAGVDADAVVVLLDACGPRPRHARCCAARPAGCAPSQGGAWTGLRRGRERLLCCRALRRLRCPGRPSPPSPGLARRCPTMSARVTDACGGREGTDAPKAAKTLAPAVARVLYTQAEGPRGWKARPQPRARPGERAARSSEHRCPFSGCAAAVSTARGSGSKLWSQARNFRWTAVSLFCWSCCARRGPAQCAP